MIFLIFYDFTNIKTNTPNMIKISSSAYIILNTLKTILYFWFWVLSFKFINRLEIKNAGKKKALYSLFFIFSIIKWLLFMVSMIYILVKLSSIDDLDAQQPVQPWFRNFQWMTFLVSDVMLGFCAYVYFVTIDKIYKISSAASSIDNETSQDNQEQMMQIEDFRLGDIALSTKNSLITHRASK